MALKNNGTFQQLCLPLIEGRHIDFGSVLVGVGVRRRRPGPRPRPRRHTIPCPHNKINNMWWNVIIFGDMHL